MPLDVADSSFQRFPVDTVRSHGLDEQIGLDESDPDELISTLKEGLPVAAFDELRHALDLSRLELAGALAVSERTLARRLKAGRFTAEESERIYRLSRLLSQATDVLESRAEATVWLKTPKRYLKMRTQLEYADTEVGARTVERLLGRIDHGVIG
jgi:putative toxin-antitoxin system antitoxin component (TIGR02293 family)